MATGAAPHTAEPPERLYLQSVENGSGLCAVHDLSQPPIPGQCKQALKGGPRRRAPTCVTTCTIDNRKCWNVMQLKA